MFKLSCFYEKRWDETNLKDKDIRLHVDNRQIRLMIKSLNKIIYRYDQYSLLKWLKEMEDNAKNKCYNVGRWYRIL